MKISTVQTKINNTNYLFGKHHMPKIILTEEKLNAIIHESIMEAIEEAGGLEKLAGWAGRTYQKFLNKKNNMKGAWKMGRNYERWNNRDFDPAAQYSSDADNIRNFGGPEYSAYRYNTTVQRNTDAPQYTRQKNRGVGSEQGKELPVTNNRTSDRTKGLQPNPDLTAMSSGQQGKQQSYPVGSRVELYNNGNTNQGTIQKLHDMTAALTNSGLEPIYGKDDPQHRGTPVGWRPKNGARITPQQRSLVQQWEKYKLRESK